MKFIANILTKGVFSDKELYNVVNKKENLIKGVPTLVIGWEFTKSMYPNANILDWNIENNIYWTFGNRERRSQYEKNIEIFKKLSIRNFIKSVDYRFINVITESAEYKKEFFKDVKANSDKISVYISNNMVYIYNKDNNFVNGISLDDIEYEGCDKKRILSYLYSDKNIKIIDSKDLSADIKISLRNCNYAIPYLCS